MSKALKECNIRAVKSKRSGSWSLAHFETLHEAMNWIAPCNRYCVFDMKTEGEPVIDMKNWDIGSDNGIWEDPPVEEQIVNSERVPFNG